MYPIKIYRFKRIQIKKHFHSVFALMLFKLFSELDTLCLKITYLLKFYLLNDFYV